MAYIIFALICIFEVAFTIYRIRFVSSKQKLSSYVRLTVFIIFLLLCLFHIVNWGIRWYLFGVFLFVLALRSLYYLTISYKKPKQFHKKKTILKAFCYIIIFSITLIPAFLFPQYKELKPTGEYRVATAQYTYTSDSIIDLFTGGKRQVNVGFWFPKNADGRYPLIIFSHGAFGIKDSNQSAFEELASHGYVVCSIDHPGHSFYTKSDNGHVVYVNMDYLNEVLHSNEDTYYSNSEGYELIQKWMKIRTEDINFTIDTILRYAIKTNQETAADTSNATGRSKADELQPYRLINCDKIGIFGHSMGAAASVQIGSERKDIDAVINIDGPYFSEMVYDASTDEFIATKEPYNTPVLNIYSDQVWVQLKDGTDTGVYAGNKISDQICKESYDVYLKGTKHLTLTDLSLASPFLTDLLDGQSSTVDARKSIKLENSMILEFFDAKLKDIGEFSAQGIYEWYIANN